MATSEAKKSSNGEGVVEDAGIDGYSALYDQIHSMYREGAIAGESGDPNELMSRQRAASDAETEGISGFFRYGIHKLYGLLSSDQDPARVEEEYKSADQASRTADRKIQASTEADKYKNAFQQLAGQLQMESLLAQQSNDADREEKLAEMQHGGALEQIDQMANLPFSAFHGLFKSKAEQDNAINQLKQAANIAKDRADVHLQNKEMARERNDADRMRAAKLEAAGDLTGARRQELDEQLGAQERALDPYDYKELTRLQQIHRQTVANFDANTARQAKLQQAQSDDRILGFKEETKEAQLRAEGKADEARTSATNFSTEQRVRQLKEQADAESDATRKKQLLNEAAAAADAGKTEREALSKELQKSTAVQPAGESAVALADVSKRLNDAATKLEKATSNLRNVSVLKD